MSASARWCPASADTTTLPVARASRATSRASSSFTATTPASTASVQGAGAWCGVRISRTASMAIPTAAPSIITATVAAASASARP